jgi:lysophospholipase L1-like esterase
MNRRGFLAFCACIPAARLIPTPRLLAFGDSITVGDGASAYTNGWAQLVARQTGLVLDNRAMSGTRMQEQQAAIAAATITPADTIVWLTGYNDMRIGTPLEDYRAGLRSALAGIPGAYVGNCLRMLAASYAIPPNDKGSDARVGDFNAVIAEEVRAAGCRLVDASAAYDPRDSDDTIHPNDTGHAAIARAFLVAMRRMVYLPIR